MLLIFTCPDCGHDHDDPADGSYTLAALCRDCELVAVLEARAAAPPRRADIAAAA